MSRGKHYCKQLVPSRTLSVDQCCILRHSRCLMMVVKLSSELSIKDCVGSRRSHVYLKSWVSVHCLSWAWPCQELKPQTREAIARFSSPIPHHEPSPCSEEVVKSSLLVHVLVFIVVVENGHHCSLPLNVLSLKIGSLQRLILTEFNY